MTNNDPVTPGALKALYDWLDVPAIDRNVIALSLDFDRLLNAYDTLLAAVAERDARIAELERELDELRKPIRVIDANASHVQVQIVPARPEPNTMEPGTCDHDWEDIDHDENYSIDVCMNCGLMKLLDKKSGKVTLSEGKPDLSAKAVHAGRQMMLYSNSPIGDFGVQIYAEPLKPTRNVGEIDNLTLQEVRDDLADVPHSKCSSKTGYDQPECPICHNCRRVDFVEDYEPFTVVGEVVPRTSWVVYVCQTCKVVIVANFRVRYAGDGDYMDACGLSDVEFALPFDEYNALHWDNRTRNAFIRTHMPDHTEPHHVPARGDVVWKAGEPVVLWWTCEIDGWKLVVEFDPGNQTAEYNWHVHPPQGQGFGRIGCAKTLEIAQESAETCMKALVHDKGMKE